MVRDLEVIKDSYRVLAVQPVDMFPNTFHIESVARLEKNNALFYTAFDNTNDPIVLRFLAKSSYIFPGFRLTSKE